MQWYYAFNGQRLGPVTHEEFVKLVTDGIIRGDTLVWSQGMGEWQPYVKVAGGAGATTAPTVDDGTELCAVSGKRYPRSQMINHGGKWISAEHRDAYFQRYREGVAQQLVGDPTVPGPFGYGGFWRRFAAWVIDSMVVGGVFMVLAMVLAMFIGATMRGSSGEPSAAVLIMVFGIYGVVFLVALFYHTYLTSKYGATWGKMAMGLKVVRADGSALSFGRSLGRFFAHGLSSLVMNIGYIIAGFDDQKRALHDHVCDTRVIKTR